MSVSNIDSSALLSSLSIEAKQPKTTQKKEMGQEVFLELMITQMKNQNPLDPQDSSEFVAQLAQFSSVEGLDKLNDNVSKVASSLQSSQALQASALVGRSVKVRTDTAQFTGQKPVVGTVDVPFSTSGLLMNVYSPNGELVWQQDLGSQAPGEVDFGWQGVAADGRALPPGNYRFEAIGSREDGPVKLNTFLAANVNSVTIGANNTMTINVQGLGPVGLSQVKEIL